MDTDRSLTGGVIMQAYFTHSVRGIDGRPGWGFCAISSGLARHRALLANLQEQLAEYRLPYGFDVVKLGQAAAPQVLEFRPYGARSLHHKAFVQKDAFGRNGNHFAHAITNLPADFSAREAIALWGSTFWVKSDDGLDPQKPLPDLHSIEDVPKCNLDALVAATGLSPVLVARFIEDYLSLEAEERLAVVLEADKVAALVYCLTRALPKSLQNDISFTTYHWDPLNKDSRIVGAQLSDAHRLAAVPRARLRVFRLDAEEVDQPISDARHFSQFAAAALLSGIDDLLRKVHQQADVWGVTEPEGLLLCYRYVIEPSKLDISKDRWRIALETSSKAVSSLLSTKHEAIRRLADYVSTVGGRQLWERRLSEMAVDVSLHEWRQSELAKALRDLLGSALAGGLSTDSLRGYARFVVELLPKGDPGGALTEMLHALQRIGLQERQYLILCLDAVWPTSKAAVEGQLVPEKWDETNVLLELIANKAWRDAIIHASVSALTNSPGVATALVKHQSLAADAFASLPSHWIEYAMMCVKEVALANPGIGAQLRRAIFRRIADIPDPSERVSVLETCVRDCDEDGFLLLFSKEPGLGEWAVKLIVEQDNAPLTQRMSAIFDTQDGSDEKRRILRAVAQMIQHHAQPASAGGHSRVLNSAVACAESYELLSTASEVGPSGGTSPRMVMDAAETLGWTGSKGCRTLLAAALSNALFNEGSATSIATVYGVADWYSKRSSDWDFWADVQPITQCRLALLAIDSTSPRGQSVLDLGKSLRLAYDFGVPVASRIAMLTSLEGNLGQLPNSDKLKESIPRAMKMATRSKTTDSFALEALGEWNRVLMSAGNAPNSTSSGSPFGNLVGVVLAGFILLIVIIVAAIMFGSIQRLFDRPFGNSPGLQPLISSLRASIGAT